MIARLAEGVTLEQARAEITTLARETARNFPQSNQDLVPEVVTYQERANGPQNAVMYWSLLGAAVFVLLIACANVANLLLARSFHRLARSAFGSHWGEPLADRPTVAVESVSLAAIGGVLSVPLVMLGVRLFDQMTQDAGRPYYVTYAIEPSVFAIIAAICLAVGIGFGLAPAWHSAKADVNVSMKEGSGSSGSRRQHLGGDDDRVAGSGSRSSCCLAQGC